MSERTALSVVEALLQNERAFRLVFSQELDPMSLFDRATGQILDVNASWLALYGYTREEALRMTVRDVSAEPQATAKAMAAKSTRRVDVRWHRTKAGRVFPVELTCGELRLGERDVMYAAMRDITEREDARSALERSEASFRGLIECLPDGVLLHRSGAVVYMNPCARALLGYDASADVTALDPLDLVHPEDREKPIARVVQGCADAPSLVEDRLARRDGTFVVAEVRALPSAFDGGPATLVLVRDVSARKELEGQLLLNDRLASLGRLSASVGHELNNPLAYVLGNVAMMSRDLAAAHGLPVAFVERFETYIRVVKEGAERMRNIVHDLRTLGRGEHAVERSAIDVSQILDVCVNMAEHELRPRARVVKDYVDPVFVYGTEARLGQVFLNLLVNAAQAIPEGDADAHEVRISVQALAGGKAQVTIADTGVGIAPEHLERIFEPFFTTKSGGGTGLGLAISHRIVTSAGGTLSVESRPGGTAFRVVLPAHT